MIHPLFHLIATRPHLLADHAEAYGELAGEELARLGAQWRRRLLLVVVALCCLGVAATRAGVAVMLWAVVPSPGPHTPWALLATPLAPLPLAALCLFSARSAARQGPFESLREQLVADLAMLRSVSAQAA